MRVLRGLLGALLWLGAGLLGLISLILCVTVILLPLGIPLFRLSKALFGKAVRLMLPAAVAHPVKHAGRKSSKAKADVSGVVARTAKKSRKSKIETPEVVQKATKKGRKLAKKHRKRLAASV